MELSTRVILSLQKCLNSNLSNNVRGICCDWDDGFDWFKLRYYLNIEPNEEERELMSVLLTEFECDIQDFKKFHEEFIYLKEKFEIVDTLRCIIMWREDPYYRNMMPAQNIDNESMYVQTRLTLQRSLIGRLSYNVRGICFDWDDHFDWFRLRYYLNIEPNEEEYRLMLDVLEAFCSEITNFKNIYKECLYTSEEFSKIDKLGNVVIWQNEEFD